MTDGPAVDRHQFPDGRPKKTGATLHDSVARVLVHDTTVDNDTVRITIEHPDLAGGVSSYLRYEPETVAPAIRSSVSKLSDDVVRVDLVDDADVGLSEAELLGETGTPIQPGPEISEVNCLVA